MVTLFLALLDHLTEPLHDSQILVGEERRTAFVQRSYPSHLLIRQNLGFSPRQFRAALLNHVQTVGLCSVFIVRFHL